MTLAPLDELHFLTEALKAHVEWTKSTGTYGVPACDETWLQARREHYRQTPFLGDAELQPAALGASGAHTPPDEFVAGDAATPQAATTSNASVAPATPKPVPLKVAGSRAAATATSASLPSASLPSASPPRPRTPSTVGSEVATLISEAEPANDGLPRATPNEARAVSPVTPPEKAAESLAALSVEERRERLTLLESQVRQCRDCGLCEGRTNTVFARGNGSIGVAFVGEGPGADEDAQGYPFVGAAGQLLDKMIAAMGLDRESVYVCNIVKCRPPNNRKPTEEEMATCRHYVVSQLDLIQPRVIVALGATAVEGLLGLKLGITRMRGTWRLYKGSIPVMPTFHPAYLLRQPDAKREVWEDLQAVLTRINMPLPERRK
jgi:uracil-DNA glycosylase